MARSHRCGPRRGGILLFCSRIWSNPPSSPRDLAEKFLEPRKRHGARLHGAPCRPWSSSLAMEDVTWCCIKRRLAGTSCGHLRSLVLHLSLPHGAGAPGYRRIAIYPVGFRLVSVGLASCQVDLIPDLHLLDGHPTSSNPASHHRAADPLHQTRQNRLQLVRRGRPNSWNQTIFNQWQLGTLGNRRRLRWHPIADGTDPHFFRLGLPRQHGLVEKSTALCVSYSTRHPRKHAPPHFHFRHRRIR